MINFELGKIPPQNIDIEEIVLSVLLQDKNAIYEVINILDADCFYKEAHQQIYQAIHDLCIENKGIDILTVTDKLKKQSLLEGVGGPFFISQLSSKASSSHNLPTHVEILKDAAIKRGMIKICSEVQEMAYDDEVEGKDVITKTEAENYKLNSFSNK